MSADTHAYVLTKSDTAYNLYDIDGTGFSETVKASNLHSVDVFFGNTLICGSEDCLDVVRGTDYCFSGGTFVIKDKTRTFITIKGGVTDVHLHDITLIGKPSFLWDISLGDHTIYNNDNPDLPKTRRIHINNIVRYSDETMTNRLPVRILVMDAKVPIIKDYDKKYYKVYVIPSFLVKLLFFIKRKFKI